MSGSAIWEGIPAGWVNRLYEQADLKASAEELRRSTAWVAHTLRGMLHGIQAMHEEARAQFKQAQEESRSEEDSAKKRIRKYFHRMLVLEHKIITHESVTTEEDRADIIGSKVERSAPESRAIHTQRLGLEAAILLHSGKFIAALYWYTWLLNRAHQGHAAMALWNIGRGASEWEVGRKRLALRTLENAGWHTAADGRPFVVARNAARLAAIYAAIGREHEAASWLECLERVDCPAATIAAFRRRGDWLRLHAHHRRHLVLV